ncbi:MoxR family ATPase [Amycolatopsis rubida]|uniref:MoxR family ATPase n=1 Tax=Amycolatopsis rubida TaxID=112413 RepID=A0A1I5Q079_9PSEU|nr:MULTISPECIES: MoxR family ATPase [Amycolatopsis]MYW95534.1 AAA domain-containing protein [Amycolatopsis rubida]NEC60523.1 MoxR family ATPase [Amycolatopsis rubida]OAP26374.1 AAA domain (dynein-related subfamily) [Amycolatopsis sp. M39]SFP39733.1 MoxR-like ATPase [Amycolatopsis rubida]
MTRLDSPDAVRRALLAEDHLVDEGLATALHLAVDLGLPLLLEGEPGVGKTGAAAALARALGSRLHRLQCYEGLGPHEALYEWNYQRQLLAIRLAEAQGSAIGEEDLFSERFLEDRPLLACLRHDGPVPPVLLIDEIDRADDEFEALLLEFLGERAITIPEFGTVRAAGPMVVVLTSNRTRELHDALRRRCLYHWIDFPGPDQVTAILRHRVPDASGDLVAAIGRGVSRLRELDLDKAPGMAEAIDWARVLAALGADVPDPAAVAPSLGAIAKTPDDLAAVGRAIREGALG